MWFRHDFTEVEHIKAQPATVLENKVAEISTHNGSSLDTSLVWTVIANSARCIHKQQYVIASISDYREYICLDPNFENFMINKISL